MPIRKDVRSMHAHRRAIAALAEASTHEGPPVCPYCARVMSNREAAEQGACNDCHGGAR